MDEIYRRTIISSWTYLIDNLTVSVEFLGHFVENEHFHEGLIEEITIQKISADQNAKFLQALKKRPNSAWTIFIKALNKTTQGFIAEALLNKKSEIENGNLND